MESDGGAADCIIFVLMLAVELLFLFFWSVSLELREIDPDISEDETENRFYQFMLKLSGGTQQYRYFEIILFSVWNFILGIIYMYMAAGWLHNVLLSVVPIIKGWPDLLVVLIHSILFVSVFLLLNILFGVWIPKSVMRTFPVKPTAEEQILSMVNEGHEQGQLEASEAEMIHNIFEFGDKEAKDIMINRSSIVAVDGSMQLSEAIDFMLAEKNSRYPIYEDNLDHIIGILHFKDAIRLQASNKRLRGMIKNYPELIREAVFIPETRNLDNLFHSMQSTKTQMVIVVDEYGQTSGLLAMEDILEEIVGNIMDEYDEEEEFIEEKGENVYEIDGLTPLDELEEELNITFDAEEFDTLNGFLISKMEHIPMDNERFEMDFKGYHFKVLTIENRMIKNVLVKKSLTVAENAKK